MFKKSLNLKKVLLQAVAKTFRKHKIAKDKIKLKKSSKNGN